MPKRDYSFPFLCLNGNIFSHIYILTGISFSVFMKIHFPAFMFRRNYAFPFIFLSGNILPCLYGFTGIYFHIFVFLQEY
jgi:hypothetical protein